MEPPGEVISSDQRLWGPLDPIQIIATNMELLMQKVTSEDAREATHGGNIVVCSCELGPLEAEAGGLQAPDRLALL